MVNDFNKDLPGQAGENLKIPEKEIPIDEQIAEIKQEAKLSPERKEISVEDRSIADELRREIETMEMDEKLKEEAKKKALKIEFLGEQEKIEHLLKIAHEKGIVFAIKTAKATNDPYLLDVLHDVLAREGYYKKMSQSATDDDDDNKN